MKKNYKTLEKVLIEYQKSKKPISVIYKTHTGMASDPRYNLVVEEFDDTTGFLQFAYYEKDKKEATVYTTKDEIIRIIVPEE